MSSSTLNDVSRWLRRPLCRRYAFVQFSEFQLSELQDGVPRQRQWLWGFGMFRPNECEILGAWPADTGTIGTIADDLRRRGILSIRVVSTADALGKKDVPQRSSKLWTLAAGDRGPRVLAVASPQALAANEVEGVCTSTIQSAAHAARRIQSGLICSARARSPLPSTPASAEFISNWLQRADQRLHATRLAAANIVISDSSTEPRPS